MKFFTKKSVLFSLLFVFSLAAVLSAQAQTQCNFPGFSNGTEFQSGQNPTTLASGDVNNDGKLDVVSSNSEAGGVNNTISVFLGDGVGGFSSHTQYTTGRYPTAVYLKDLNADAKLDAVVLNQTDQKMTIMLGNGAGAFSILTQYPIYNAFVVETADINHDSKIDMLISAGDSYIANMHFYPGIGDGSFGAPVVTTMPGNFNNPSSPDFGDFNNDGEMDFVYLTGSGVTFWSGNGTGNFTQGWISTAWQGGIVAGNLNNDSHLDFLTIDGSFNRRITIFLGNGDGTFQVGERYNNIAAVPVKTRIADLNADGINDIVSTHWTANEISVLVGTGGGRFNQPKNYTVANKPRGLVIGDFSGDGKPDLITTSFRYNSIMLTLGNGDGTFRAATNIKNAQDTYSNASVSADFNADGREDFVTANSNFFGLYVYLRNGNFKFQEPQKYLQSIGVRSLNTGDFNADGKLDIVAVGGTEGRILLGDGFGGFSTLPVFTTGTTGGFSAFVDSADFNGDAKLDLVIANRDHGSVSVLFGNGNGTFSSPTDYQSGGLMFEIAIGDFNADGRKDLAIVSDNDFSANGKVIVRLNAGNGTFPSQTEYIVGQSIHPRGIVTADFNRDGKLDIAVSTITDTVNPYDLYIFNGNGNGTFNSQSLRYSTAALSPWDLVAKDFNNDGKLDIATSNYSSEDVTVFSGNGDSTFTRVQRISAGTGPVSITTGNFNNDTSTDLLVTSQGELTLIPNDCNRAVDSSGKYDFDGDGKTDIGIYRPSTGAWWISQSGNSQVYAVGFGNSTDRIVPADFTGDGKTDLALFRESSGEWFILRSDNNTFYGFPFGSSGDKAVPADFDGDGKADPTVYRASNSGWYSILSSNGSVSSRTFGLSEDVPLPNDYDGDGKADLGIFRPSTSAWWIQRSSNSSIYAAQFGAAGDKPTPADFTGDGKTDFAFYRPSNATWYVLRSEDSSFYGFPFGAASDTPVAGDYDGDGKADAAVFRASDNGWYLLRSTQGFTAVTFGTSGDKPVPSAYLP